MKKWYEYIENYPIDNIVISESYAKTNPRKSKLKQKRRDIDNGTAGKIVINKDNVLQDGYITYLILKDKGVDNISVMLNLGEKANSYKLKNNITKDDLLVLGFKEGSWQSQYKDIECLSKSIELVGSIYLYITIKTNPMEFDDFVDILVLDDDFCQPYTPFYGDNYKQNIDDYSYLQRVVSRYNQVIDLCGSFKKV